MHRHDGKVFKAIAGPSITAHLLTSVTVGEPTPAK
jgi:hypothetical protein